MQVERDVGELIAERVDDWRKDTRADALVGTHAQLAGPPCAKRFDIGRGCVDLGDDRVGVAQQRLARLSQPDAPTTTRTLDESLPGRALERRDLLADGALGVAERFGCAGERALAGN